MTQTTIFAPATAIGKAGVAVFRISGAQARQAVAYLCQPSHMPAARRAERRVLRHPQSGEAVDHILLLYFPAPHSFTGEDVVEFHTHGGRAVAQAVTDCLHLLPQFRLAEPGEFTRRAFENGKMDLTEAEAIADLVHAETEAQRRQALRQVEGSLGQLYESWRAQLTHSLAYLEAAIDFADEDLPDHLALQQKNALGILRAGIAAHLDDKHRGELIRDGIAIAILGPPNAGKSSLLNALARRDAAIVSPLAGTTRDVIEVQLDIGGYKVTLADTAGLRETADAIESEGVRRALRQAEHADLKILLFDGADWPQLDATTLALADSDTLLVMNKADLIGDSLNPSAVSASLSACLFVSARQGNGISALLQKLGAEVAARLDLGAAPPLTRVRHRAALQECVQHLDRALQAPMADMRAEDVRLAMRSLGRLTGRVDVEDLLDIIFRDFCIGK